MRKKLPLRTCIVGTGLLFSNILTAQNVGINATGAAPDASAMLDIVSANRGLLIPRVALTATNAAGPIAAPTTSLLVYNTATAGAGLTAVIPGYYYWDGAAWVRFQASNTIDDWKLLGNAGTVAGTNFVGTTDAQHLDFRTNNTQRVRIMNSTHPTVGVGTAFPVTNLSGTTAVLHVHDGGGNVGSQLILSNNSTTSGDRAGLVNFAATQVTNDRRTASIESYLTNYTAPNATGDLRFFTNNANSFTEKMRIEGDGDVGIGATPDASAKLDVSATNKGFLAPRVALTATNAAGPITTPATSLLVYNTATAGAAPNNVTPGYYYWNGASWVRFDTGNNIGDWKLLGNANTTSGTNFLGTTNAQALDFRTNSTLRFRIPNADQVHAMTNGTPSLPFYSWDVDPDIGMYRIGVNTLGFSSNGVERLRLGATEAVFNEGADNYDFRIEGTSNANLFFLDASVNRIGIGSINTEGVVDVRGNFVGGPGTVGALASFNSNVNGVGINAGGQNTFYNGLPTGSGIASNGFSTSIVALYTTAGIGEAIYAADAFGANWRVGHWTGAAYRKIIGTGTVSTIVKDTNDVFVVMNCPETPENLFFDYGIGQMVNGRAYIKIDPNLSKNILVDEEHPLKIFIQLEGECNGVYVTNKSAKGFEVIELNSGTSNVEFSYKIVATMGYQKITSPEGYSRTADYSKRWEKAPELLPTINPLIPVD